MRVCSGYILETDSRGKHKWNFEVPGSKASVYKLLKQQHPKAEKIVITVKYKKGGKAR